VTVRRGRAGRFRVAWGVEEIQSLLAASPHASAGTVARRIHPSTGRRWIGALGGPLVAGAVALGCPWSQAGALDGRAPQRPDAAPRAVRSVVLADAATPSRAPASDAGAARPAPAGWTPPEVRCRGHALQHDVVRRAKACPARTVGRVTQWAPDAVVVLGGGMLSDGAPNCATVQRGYIAAQLDEALRGAPPTFVFSGYGGDSRAPAVMDESDARCVAARLRQESAAARGASARQRLAREADGLREGAPRAMTEADAMCAVMLRRTEPTRRDALLGRVRFEARATTTAQNALFTRPALAAGRFRRVLVLTSPVLKRFGRGADLHADRALEGFQFARRGGGWALAAVGCPIVEGAGIHTWYRFEATTTMPGGMEMDTARR
jgi:hypothetical protein